MPDPGFTRPDLCSIRAAAEQDELADSSPRRGSAPTAAHRAMMTRPRPPGRRGIDRAIRLSTAAAVLAVAGIAAYVSYWHAYAVVRAHGETGITARLEPATIDGLVYASSMVVLYAARHRVPVPSLARWLLGLGIAATLTANMAQGWSHGPVGAVVAAWPAVSLVGSYELLVWLIRTSGAVERRPSAEHLGEDAVCRDVVCSAPAAAVDSEQHRRDDRDLSAQVGGPVGSRPLTLAHSKMTRLLKPPPTMTQRSPHTGSACKSAIPSPNVSSPRRSDGPPDAGPAPGSPKHGNHRDQPGKWWSPPGPRPTTVRFQDRARCPQAPE